MSLVSKSQSGLDTMLSNVRVVPIDSPVGASLPEVLSPVAADKSGLCMFYVVFRCLPNFVFWFLDFNFCL